jgi:hypothetical protein
LERNTNSGKPSPNLDGEKEGIYVANMGSQVGVSLDGDPKKEVNQNPQDAVNKRDPEMLKLNRLINGRDIR